MWQEVKNIQLKWPLKKFDQKIYKPFIIIKEIKQEVSWNIRIMCNIQCV